MEYRRRKKHQQEKDGGEVHPQNEEDRESLIGSRSASIIVETKVICKICGVKLA